MNNRVRYGLNGSTVQPLSQEDEVRAVGAAGFDLLEFRAPKIGSFLERGTLPELNRLVAQAGLEPLSINSLEQTDTRPFGKVEEECARLADWAAELGCPYVVSVPGFSEMATGTEDRAGAVGERLAALAEVCGARGVKLGFEFLGFANCTVNRLATARELVRKVASPHLGLVLDTCHFHLSGEPVETLRGLRPGELLLLHVNDVEDRPREELRDPHRLLPGRGVIRLAGMWQALRERELVDHASLELFRPEYWQRNPEAFLAEALDALRSTFS